VIRLDRRLLCNSDPMMAFGEQLRRAREASGLSLDELSARTKIRTSVLDAIERSDVARLPSPFYTKSFLRAYAAEVHLAADPIVREYSALFELPPPSPEQRRESPVTREVVPTIAEVVGLIRPALAPAAILALAGVLLFGVFRLSQTDRVASSAPVAEPGAVATSGAAASAPAPDTPAHTDSAVAPSPQPEPLTVEVRPTGLLWLEGTADGKRVIRRLLQPREMVAVTAREEITLRIGDAAAFDYSVNGRQGRPLGGPGEVRTIDITPDNYRTFLSTSPTSAP
jgi:cytoskeleton protein RodZ